MLIFKKSNLISALFSISYFFFFLVIFAPSKPRLFSKRSNHPDFEKLKGRKCSDFFVFFFFFSQQYIFLSLFLILGALAGEK